MRLRQQITMDDSANGESCCSSQSSCYDGKRHYWKDGWVCEKCGIRRADYEDMKRHNKEVCGERSESK